MSFFGVKRINLCELLVFFFIYVMASGTFPTVSYAAGYRKVTPEQLEEINRKIREASEELHEDIEAGRAPTPNTGEIDFGSGESAVRENQGEDDTGEGKDDEAQTAESPDDEQTSDNEEPVAITISAAFEGYEPYSTTVYTDHFSPSSVSVSGRVQDFAGVPLANVRVTLPDLGASAISDKLGYFQISVATEGTRPFSRNVDIVLKEIIREVSAFAETGEPSPLYANGRPGTAAIHIMANGKPYKNKEVHVIQTGLFQVRGVPSSMFALPKATSEKVITDDLGWATITLNSPRVIPGRIDAWTNSQNFFPATGFLDLRGEWDASLKVNIPYKIYNPFPVVRKLTIPGNVDEESWQIVPSRVYINDPDSQFSGGWKITVEALGSLKIRQGSVVERKLFVETASNPFEFYFRPPKIGFDLNKQPELGAQLIETNLKVALNLIVGNLEGRINNLPQGQSMQVMSGDIKAAHDAAKDALAYLDRATDTMNLVTSSPESSPGEEIIKGFDYAFSMTETALGLIGAEFGTSLEVAKGAYENAKVFYTAFKDYEKIANAYQDVIFVPITVTVEDELGHKTKKAGECAVKVWATLP
jgi:hypothetical protein